LHTHACTGFPAGRCTVCTHYHTALARTFYTHTRLGLPHTVCHSTAAHWFLPYHGFGLFYTFHTGLPLRTRTVAHTPHTTRGLYTTTFCRYTRGYCRYAPYRTAARATPIPRTHTVAALGCMVCATRCTRLHHAFAPGFGCYVLPWLLGLPLPLPLGLHCGSWFTTHTLPWFRMVLHTRVWLPLLHFALHAHPHGLRTLHTTRVWVWVYAYTLRFAGLPHGLRGLRTPAALPRAPLPAHFAHSTAGTALTPHRHCGFALLLNTPRGHARTAPRARPATFTARTRPSSRAPLRCCHCTHTPLARCLVSTTRTHYAAAHYALPRTHGTHTCHTRTPGLAALPLLRAVYRTAHARRHTTKTLPWLPRCNTRMPHGCTYLPAVRAVQRFAARALSPAAAPMALYCAVPLRTCAHRLARAARYTAASNALLRCCLRRMPAAALPRFMPFTAALLRCLATRSDASRTRCLYTTCHLYA